MTPLALNIQTLYADLAQAMTFSERLPGSLSRRTIKGKTYLYATEKHGGSRLQIFLGPADDPAVVERASEIRRAATDAKQRRSTVALLKRAGLPAPTLEVGRLLEALANAGLFERGLMLVGTIAYQQFAPLLGVIPTASALQTQDADLAAASLAVHADQEGVALIDILRRADATYTPALGLDRKALPKRFRSASGFDIDMITHYRTRSDDENGVTLPGLSCSAQPLRFLEYLMEDPVDVVALYNAGVLVRVPQPARYAVHKLIIAQERRINPAKRAKDLLQAESIIVALCKNDPASIDDALADGRSRGARWRDNIEKSIRALPPQIAESLQHSGKSA